MSNKTILIGEIVSGLIRHQQSTWSPGDTLVDPDGNVLLTIDNLGEINVGGTEPTPEEGKLWLFTDISNSILRIYENSAWRDLFTFEGGNVYVDGGTF